MATPYPQLTLRDLYELVGPKPKAKAANSKVIKIRTRKNQRRFSFIVLSKESYSSPKGHLVSFIYPTLKVPFNQIRKYPQITPMNLRVKVRCTCQAWRYWGSSFLSTEYGYFLDKKESRPANIRDPGRKNYICKHVVRVILFTRMLTFPGLLNTFQMDSGTRTASYLEQLKPIAAQFLRDEGYDQESVDDVIFSMTEDDFEDILEQHGVLISDGG